jgi:tetratricopeptide (TPR) repeat protein
LTDLGEYDMALADINRVLEIDPNSGGYSARGHFFHGIGNYRRAIEDLTRSKDLDYDGWTTSLDPHFRADCYARMGRLNEALDDCAFIPDDHRMPAVFGLPGGNKEQFIAEIKRRALAARSNN